MVKNVKWKFPEKKFPLMKIETITISVIALIIFFVTVVQTDSFLYGIVLGIIFIGLYILLTYIIQKIRLIEENYHIDGTHLHVTKKTRFKTTKEKIPLKKVQFHRLDKFFLGGYILSDKAKHLLFFNTKKELEKCENLLKKFVKVKKK